MSSRLPQLNRALTITLKLLATIFVAALGAFAVTNNPMWFVVLMSDCLLAFAVVIASLLVEWRIHLQQIQEWDSPDREL